VALSRDLASGTQAVPTFHDAVWQQQLFEQIQDRPKQVNASTCDFDRLKARPVTAVLTELTL